VGLHSFLAGSRNLEAPRVFADGVWQKLAGLTRGH